MKTLIYIGGVYHVVLAVFHLAFWKLFRWKTSLRSLNELNRGVIQILNIHMTLVFIAVAYLSFAHPDELLASPMGRCILVAVSLFWLARAANQIVFFGLRNTLSIALFLLMLAAAGIYLYPVLY
jgi:hypothetical protein